MPKPRDQALEATVDHGEEELAAIREVRHQLSAQFGHDPYRLVAHLMELQEEHPEKLIPPPEVGHIHRATPAMRKEYDFTGAQRAKDVPHLAKLQAEAAGGKNAATETTRTATK